MRKVIEIYDIRDEYTDYQGNPYIVIISDSTLEDKSLVNSIFRSNFTTLTSKEWSDYKNILTDFKNNDAKHRMRKEVSADFLLTDKFKKINSAEIDFDSNSSVSKALNMLSPQPKRRFLEYYVEGKTYQEIANEEGRHISTIQESVLYARKKFLKYLKFFENTPEK